MSNVMDLNLIQTFLVVAEFQSYTKAAEHLGLTQPAVSASVKRLEQVVNKQLFVKRQRYRAHFNCVSTDPTVSASD